MATSKIRQELPPAGGYAPIEWTRTPAKVYFKGWQMFAAAGIFTGVAIWIFVQGRKQVFRWEIEKNSGNNAIRALLKAEMDRAYLKVIRRNRDEEEKLMKDVPGWVVGTYYGDPIFHTRPKDEWYDMTTNEYFAHARKWDLNYHYNFFKWY